MTLKAVNGDNLDTRLSRNKAHLGELYPGYLNVNCLSRIMWILKTFNYHSFRRNTGKQSGRDSSIELFKVMDEKKETLLSMWNYMCFLLEYY